MRGLGLGSLLFGLSRSVVSLGVCTAVDRLFSWTPEMEGLRYMPDLLLVTKFDIGADATPVKMNKIENLYKNWMSLLQFKIAGHTGSVQSPKIIRDDTF